MSKTGSPNRVAWVLKSRNKHRPNAKSGAVLQTEKERIMRFRMFFVGATLLGSLACAAAAQEAAPADTPEARIEMVKQQFAASKAGLKQYEWVETVALSLSGEEKVRQQYQCYYGAEGALQKIPVAADAKEDKKRGLRGKVVESKTAELEGALKAAVSLLQQYAPLDPAKINAAKAAGNVSISVPDASGRVRVTIKNYLKPGDQVEVELDTAKNVLAGVSIASVLEQAQTKSPVAAKVGYAALGDGTLYPAKTALEISAQSLKVDLQNSGYKKKVQ